MLIQGRFLKVWRVENRAFFSALEVLETMLHSPRRRSALVLQCHDGRPQQDIHRRSDCADVDA
jgi:hypothetical protein